MSAMSLMDILKLVSVCACFCDTVGNSLCVVWQIIGFVWCWARPRFVLFAFAS